MKTEDELKKLAEFAAYFSGLTPTEYNRHWLIPENLHDIFSGSVVSGLELEKYFFDNEIKAPIILAHLAKREMEQNYDHSYITSMATGTLIHQHFFSERKHRTTKREAVKDKNTFIAFWSAIEDTGEK